MTHRDDNASAPRPEAPVQPATERAATPAHASDDELETFVRHIDRRQHLLYGKVAFVALATWLVVTVLAFWALSPWTLGLMTCIGTLLVALFGMRAAVHVSSRPLDQQVEDWRRRHAMSHDELVERARTNLDPTPEFFLSLVDGPMARQRRAREAASPTPDTRDLA